MFVKLTNFVNNKWIQNENKAQTFFNNIIDLLKEDGKFIGTYLNLNDKDKHIYRNHGLPFYQIENKGSYIEVRNSVWGWNNILSEPILNQDKMTEYFDKYNFVEVSNDSFEEHYDSFKIYEGAWQPFVALIHHCICAVSQLS